MWNATGAGALSYVFISHASVDKPAIEFIIRRFKAENIDLWIDQPDHPSLRGAAPNPVGSLKPGKRWRDEIYKALRDERCAAVLVCWSKNSAKDYRDVLREEVGYARVMDKLIACCIDDLDIQELPNGLGDDQIPRLALLGHDAFLAQVIEAAKEACDAHTRDRRFAVSPSRTSLSEEQIVALVALMNRDDAIAELLQDEAPLLILVGDSADRHHHLVKRIPEIELPWRGALVRLKPSADQHLDLRAQYLMSASAERWLARDVAWPGPEKAAHDAFEQFTMRIREICGALYDPALRRAPLADVINQAMRQSRAPMLISTSVEDRPELRARNAAIFDRIRRETLSIDPTLFRVLIYVERARVMLTSSKTENWLGREVRGPGQCTVALRPIRRHQMGEWEAMVCRLVDQQPIDVHDTLQRLFEKAGGRGLSFQALEAGMKEHMRTWRLRHVATSGAKGEWSDQHVQAL